MRPDCDPTGQPSSSMPANAAHYVADDDCCSLTHRTIVLIVIITITTIMLDTVIYGLAEANGGLQVGTTRTQLGARKALESKE